AGYLAGLAERIIAAMREPVRYEGHECRFGVSVGIATEPQRGCDPRRLLVNADIALYRAKSRGRNRYQFFNDALQAEIVNTKRVADEILSGLEQGQFVAYYQPQFDAETLEVTGVEALARWNHPTEGVLGPDAFLKVAEELNVVSSIDRMILEQAIADFRNWSEQGVPIPKVSVNVSARRLSDEELIGGLGRLDFKPGSLSFELVESIFLDDNDEHIGWNVEQIKELGIDIEIDDFGTGYASIVSLIKLKPRRLKIDRQLVMPITASPAQRHLVESIIEIGKSLGIEVIAEGVETMEHARVLRQLGCRGLQGYAFARPMTSAALTAFVAARRWRKAS
ncbi:MAG TPA: EAL domain-containing protein, partial [Rhizobiales bacterium]|nr:EAL domain-containing protein [Hyphomicrobiales bacterium]